MAHFAELDENNIVLRALVVPVVKLYIAPAPTAQPLTIQTPGRLMALQ